VAAVLWTMSLRDPGRHHPLGEPTGFQALAGRSCRAVVRSARGRDVFFGVVSTGLSTGSGAAEVGADVADVAARRDGGSGRATGTATGAGEYCMMVAGGGW
jgi:hypothetical protein